jgi:hypothetical protein
MNKMQLLLDSLNSTVVWTIIGTWAVNCVTTGLVQRFVPATSWGWRLLHLVHGMLNKVDP